MDATTETLIPAAKMAAENTVRMPGESPEYRAARTVFSAAILAAGISVSVVASMAGSPV